MPKKKNILLCSANPSNESFLEKVDAEMMRISKTLIDKHQDVQITERSHLSFKRLIDTFLKTDQGNDIEWLHYCGHSSQYGILLEDAQQGEDLISLEDLKTILSNRQNLKIVFLNSCSSSFLGSKLIEGGQIEVVIETTQAIYDNDALLFSEYFYLSLTKGSTIKQAFKEAKVTLLNHSKDERGLPQRGIVRREREDFPWQLNPNTTDPEHLINKWRLVNPEPIEPRGDSSVNLLCVFPDTPKYQTYFGAVKNTIESADFKKPHGKDIFINDFLTLKRSANLSERIEQYHRFLFFLDNEQNAFWKDNYFCFETSIQQKKSGLLLVNDRANILKELLPLNGTEPILIPDLPGYTFEDLCKDKTPFEAMKSHQKKLEELICFKPKKSEEEKPKNKKTFSEHHQYTCDRGVQDQVFWSYLIEPKRIERKLHFFYLHGGIKQAHKGLFIRFCNTLRGKNSPPSAAETTASSTKVIDFDFAYPKDRDEKTVKSRLSYEIIQKLGIQNVNITPELSSKNLAYVLQNSPQLQGLSSEDKVCCFISIPGRRWEADLMPKINRWFIEQFCQKGLPENTPEFFFFFSVEYREGIQTIREEIEQSLKDAPYITLFPELSMVNLDDIEDWFDDYKVFWEDYRVQEKLIDEHFGNQADEMYMLEVQDILKNIIDKINNSEKDAPRR